MMKYKGCTGKVEFDGEAGIIHGEVIPFQGDQLPRCHAP
jgi:predicted HicB family RNase H-like nuclease